MMTAMPFLRAWPLLFVAALGACDGEDASVLTPDADTGAGPGFAGPAPALAASPGFGAPPRLAFRVLAGRGNGAVVDPDAMLAALRNAEAVCLGETHESFAVQSMQLLIADRLRAAAPDPNLALGFEMFQRPFQDALDDFSSGRIDQGTLRTRAEYDTRWGWSWENYAPLVAHGRDHGHPLRALSAARELTARVSQVGVSGLSAEEQAQMPELDLGDQAHRAWFRNIIQAVHPELTEAGFERFYTTQVIWDESMAEGSASWQKAAPGRRVLIFAGRYHCVDMAIPNRLKRRGLSRVMGLQIVEDDPAEVAQALALDPADFIVPVTLTP